MALKGDNINGKLLTFIVSIILLITIISGCFNDDDDNNKIKRKSSAIIKFNYNENISLYGINLTLSNNSIKFIYGENGNRFSMSHKDDNFLNTSEKIEGNYYISDSILYFQISGSFSNDLTTNEKMLSYDVNYLLMILKSCLGNPIEIIYSTKS